MKYTYSWMAAIVAFSAGCGAPSDQALIAKFKSNKTAYVRLRDMLQKDENLSRLAYWGVELNHPYGTSKPPDSTFPLDRYNQYLQLLEEAGAVGASRSSTQPFFPCILVFADGWAGDTRHASICWIANRPEWAARGRQIEEDWYLEKDY
jgi:hypothetical protein